MTVLARLVGRIGFSVIAVQLGEGFSPAGAIILNYLHVEPLSALVIFQLHAGPGAG